MIELQIVILTRDRLNYLEKALDSIIKSKIPEMEIVVSDNSIGIETEKLLNNNSDFKYIRRNPPLSQENHFIEVLKECSKPYLIIFHDDDLVKEEYLKVMIQEIKNDSKLVAVACNAYIINKQKLTKRKMMGFFSKSIIINNSEELLKPYFGFESYEPPPFSSYIYRTEILKKNGLSVECGKHSDVSNLNNLLKYGPIKWIPDCLMYYRFHENNDGKNFSINDKLKLMRFAIAKKGVKKLSTEISDYRIRMYIQLLVSFKKKGAIIKNFARVKIIIKYLIPKIFTIIFTKRLWVRLASRI